MSDRQGEGGGQSKVCVGVERRSCCVGLICLAGVLVTTDWPLVFLYPAGRQFGTVRPSETSLGPGGGMECRHWPEARGKGHGMAKERGHRDALAQWSTV